MEFGNTAQKSAKHYYDYLCSKEGMNSKPGKQVTDILAINKLEEKSQVFFLFRMRKPLVMWEEAKVEIDNVEYDSSKVQLVDYDEENKILRIMARSAELELLLINIDSQRVKVVSDLKFLVKRVQRWYAQYGDMLDLPTKAAGEADISFLQNETELSSQQKNAIQIALSSPFSYIWGAPGTGKTKRVLAQCILYYIRRQKPVLIVAPTNNAIEQILRGILPILREKEIPFERVLRMGLSSREFAMEYPEVCENVKLATLLAQLNDEKRKISEQLQLCEEQNRNLLRRRRWNEAFEKTKEYYERVHSVDNTVKDIFGALARLADDEVLNTESRKKAIADLDQIPDRKHRLSDRIREVERQLIECNTTLGRIFRKKRIERLNVQKSEIVHDYDVCIADEKELEKKIFEANQRERDIREKEFECRQQLKKICDEFAVAASVFSKNPPPSLERVMNKEEYIHYLDHTEEWYDGLNDAYTRAMKETEDSARLTETEVQSQIDQLCKRLEEVEKQYSLASEKSLQRNARVLVKAATMDTFIGRLDPKEPADRPTHIFLDEAGYCSLIKGATLLAFGCPVTFLGDHMQLPPVCVMGETEMNREGNEDISLWAQSVLYAENIFDQDILEIAEEYIDNIEPPFIELERVELTRTYRYGQTLADILSDYVYGIRLQGNRQYDTEVFVLDAKRSQNDPKRENEAERKAIIEYCESHCNEEIAILTPYRDQAKALEKDFKDTVFEDCIMTVHKSQGREWETVLLSVVDTKDKWLTNSLLEASRGKQVINTAVSRAKKKLIIVCDVECWKKESRQLIGRMVEQADVLK